MKQTLETIEQLVSLMEYRDWKFKITEISVYEKGEITFHEFRLQPVFLECDANYDEGLAAIEQQHGRKWIISEHATDSEVIQTAFKAVLTAVEHEVREYFKFRGQPVYSPHHDVNDLHKLCIEKKFDARSKEE